MVASAAVDKCNAEKPILSTEIPFINARFQAELPPVAMAPSFSIRIHSRGVITLDDYVEQGRATPSQREILSEAAKSRKTILVVGSTYSGKTAMLNALLHEITDPEERIVTIEEVQEIQCNCPDFVPLLVKPGREDMAALVKVSLRKSPTRLVIGEVRSKEAFDWLDAASSGHPGITTLHAGSPEQAISRLEILLLRAGMKEPPQTLIGHTIDLIVHLRRLSVESISTLNHSSTGYHFTRIGES